VVVTPGDDSARRRIALSGEYDLRRREEVRELFESVEHLSEVDINFSNVTYIDSSFLNELVALRNRVPDCSITLSGSSRHVKRVFEIVDFGRIFNIVDESQ
jgi:anti-anti-sigma factor